MQVRSARHRPRRPLRKRRPAQASSAHRLGRYNCSARPPVLPTPLAAMRLDMSCLDGAAASARAEVAELGCVVDALDSCRVVGVRRAESTDPPRRVRSAELLVEAPPTAFAMPQVENVRAP